MLQLIKVWKLLFLAILIVNSHPQTGPPTTTQSSSVITKPATNFTSERAGDTLLRISNLVGAHARLTIGLNSLADLIKQSILDALAGFFNMEESIVKDMMEIKEVDIEKVADDITGIETSNLNPDKVLEGLNHLDGLYQTFNNTAQLASETAKKELIGLVEEWKTYGEDVNLDKLNTFYNRTKAISKCSPSFPAVKNASETAVAMTELGACTKSITEAIREFPVELQKQTEKLKKMNGIYLFIRVFGPLRTMIGAYEDYVAKRTTALKIMTEETMKKVKECLFKAYSFRTRAQIVNSLKKLSDIAHKKNNTYRKWTGVFPDQFLDLVMLKEDLDGQFLKDSLNGGQNLTILNRTLEPLFTSGEVIKKVWNGIESDVKKMNESDIDNLDWMLTSLVDATSSNLGFDSSSNSFSEIVNITMTMKSSDEGKKFLESYNIIIKALDLYRKLQNNILEHEQSEAYKNVVGENDLVYRLDNAYYEAIKNKSDQPYNDFRKLFDTTAENYEKMVNNIEKFGANAKEIRGTFSNLSDWEKQAEDGEKFIMETMSPFMDRMNRSYQVVTTAKAAFEFAKRHQSFVNSGFNFEKFKSEISQFWKMVKKGIEIVKAEMEKLKILMASDYYSEIVNMRDRYRLREKLVSGTILFKLFHRVINQTESWRNFNETGDAILQVIKKVDFEDAHRSDWIEKMKVFNSMKGLIGTVSGHVLMLDNRYNGRSNEELIGLRWLVENLANVTNPEMKVKEWQEFATSLSTHLNKSLAQKPELENFINATKYIFDLDFASHKQEVLHTYANYRALVRLHMAFNDIDRCSKKTYWEKNHHWIEIVIFGVIVFLLNAIVYTVAWKKIKRDRAREEQKSR